MGVHTETPSTASSTIFKGLEMTVHGQQLVVMSELENAAAASMEERQLFPRQMPPEAA